MPILSHPTRARRAVLGASLGALLAGLSLAPAAQAGTAFVEANTLRFDAAPGEINGLTVSASDPNTFLVSDLPAITAGPGCTDAGDGSVQCTSGEQPFNFVSVFLGDRDDSGGLSETILVGARIDAGDGDDVLGGAGAPDLLIGGFGDDTFSGSGNNDVYEGGPGSDFYGRGDTFGPDAGSDVFNGGPGVDLASYDDFTGDFTAAPPVSLSLDDVANDGQPGENDNLFDVEDASAGSGDDVLIGNPETNSLAGGAGRDRVDGLGGVDSLSGGSENDAVVGGDGPDDVVGGDGDDFVDGGTGDDNLFGGAGQDGLAGGPGDDNLEGGSGADVLGGGDGVDTVDYSLRFFDDEPSFSGGERVVATLDGAPDDGVPGENDNALADVENVSTGSGADLVTGNGAANGIVTGAGNDIVNSRDASSDSVICGEGFDTVRADASDRVDDEGEDRCERIEVTGGAGPGNPPGQNPPAGKVRPRSVIVTVSPARDRRAPFAFRVRGRLSLPQGLAPDAACRSGRVTVRITKGSKTLRSSRVRLQADCRYSATLRFSGRAARRARGRLKVRVRFGGNDALTARGAAARGVRAG